MNLSTDRTRRLVLGIMLCCGLAACHRGPTDPEARARFIGEQIRCPVCRGIPIAESPAELATEMMGVVREQIAGGKSDAEIFQCFEDRYGEWALLQPKPVGMNLLVWILPAGFLLGGAAIIVARVRRRGEQ